MGCDKIVQEILDVVQKLEVLESNQALTLLAASTRQYVFCLNIVFSESDIVFVSLGKQLRNVLQAALELLLEDKPTYVHCSEVWDIIEDAKIYVQMINRHALDHFSILNDLIQGLQEKVEQDFAFLSKFHHSTCSCKHLSSEIVLKEIDQKDVERVPEAIDQKDVLGEGSYGTVYKAKLWGREIRDTGDCKWSHSCIKPELELQKMLQAKAPHHVVQMLAHFENKTNGNKSFVLELMDKDLRNFIRSSPSFSLLQKIDIMIKISKGMSYLHDNEVIHRDLNPSNIMISSTAVKITAKSVKITDFDNSNYLHDNEVIHRDLSSSNIMLSANSVKITDLCISKGPGADPMKLLLGLMMQMAGAQAGSGVGIRTMTPLSRSNQLVPRTFALGTAASALGRDQGPEKKRKCVSCGNMTQSR